MTQSIEELGEIAEQKRKLYEAMGQSNVFGLTAEQRIMRDIQYRTAQAEFNQAMNNYYNALQFHAATKRSGGFNDTQ